MALTKFDKKGKFFLAKLAEKSAPCAFCRREADEETIYGKLYSIGNIHCHYFCVLLSCCLIQRGTDEHGLFGFMYPDILAEIERSKKHKCSYCNREGATLGCSVAACKKQFHLPCGRERNAVSLFYGNYKSYCENHVPKQSIPDNIMANARARKSLQKKLQGVPKSKLKKIKKEILENAEIIETVCVICYEAVDGYPTSQTFWPPCCGRDAWFHRNCLQRMALSAGIHYLKCPLCNDKEQFYNAVLDQGYYIPDRDAAWELEQNAFSEIYERSFSCNLEKCLCPNGRDYDADVGQWDILVCVLCGSYGAHAWCKKQAEAINAVTTEKTKTEVTTEGGKEDNVSNLQAAAESQTVVEEVQELGSQSMIEAIATPEAVGEADLHLVENSQEITEISAIAASRAVVDLHSVPETNLQTVLDAQVDTESNLQANAILQTNASSQASASLQAITQNVIAQAMVITQEIASSQTTAIPQTTAEITQLVTETNTQKTVEEPSQVTVVTSAQADAENEVAFSGPYVCTACAPSASDAPNLVAALHALALQEANSNSREEENVCGPRMPSRMSIRRTKPRRVLMQTPSSSNARNAEVKIEAPTNTELSRLELNLKPPKKRTIIEPSILNTIENKLISPIKLLEQGLNERISRMNLENIDLDSVKVLECMRQRFRKPKPLAIKKKIVDTILEELLRNVPKEKPKVKEPIREWNSPRKSELIKELNSPRKSELSRELNSAKKSEPISLKNTEVTPIKTKIEESPNLINKTDSFESRTKTIDIQNDSAMEISEHDEIINIDLVKINPGTDTKLPNLTLKSPVKVQRCSFKFSPTDKEKLQNTDLGLDIESFKNHYLNEVDKGFVCKNHKHIESDIGERKLRTAIDFAIDAYKSGEKRKLEENDAVDAKKQKTDILLTYDNVKKKKSSKKLSIRNKDIKVKIRWKKEKLKLKITDKRRKKCKDSKIKNRKNDSKLKDTPKTSKSKTSLKRNSPKDLKVKVSPKNSKGSPNNGKSSSPKILKCSPKTSKGVSPKSSNEDSPKTLKQYVLNYNLDAINANLIKPETDVNPIKKKVVKKEKPSDNFIQTSLHSFFKRKSE